MKCLSMFVNQTDQLGLSAGPGGPAFIRTQDFQGQLKTQAGQFDSNIDKHIIVLKIRARLFYPGDVLPT